jgi:ribonuclease HII
MMSLERGMSAWDAVPGSIGGPDGEIATGEATGEAGASVADVLPQPAPGVVPDADTRMISDPSRGRPPADALADHAMAVPACPPGRSVLRPPGYTPRRGAGLSGYERVLARAGLAPIAGIDEAGRGACAGPLVVAAVVFPTPDPAVAQLADSKALTPAVREQVYREVVANALSWHTVVIAPGEIDRLGLHVCNIAGMRRALAGISCRPGYVLTDGFPVGGLTVPALAMWKGDQVAACVAAASVVAKVTRDRIMTKLHDRYPAYDFAEHKGYSTRRHTQALAEHGPCPEHRFSYVNVMCAIQRRDAGARPMPDNGGMADVACTVDGARIGVPAAGGAANGAGFAARADLAEETSGAF